MILFIDLTLDDLGGNIDGNARNLVFELVHGFLLLLLDLCVRLLHQAGSLALGVADDLLAVKLRLAGRALDDVGSLCLCVGDALLIFVAQLLSSGLRGLGIGIALVDLRLAGIQNILYGLEKKVFEQQEQQQKVNQLCDDFLRDNGN